MPAYLEIVAAEKLKALTMTERNTEVLCACSDSCAKDAEIERLRTALREIAAMRSEDLPLADGLPEDNLAAHHARITLEQSAEEREK